jgi:hypothetical protein
MSRLVWLLGSLTACAAAPATPVASLQQVVVQQMASQAPYAQQEGQFLVGAGPKADFSLMLEKGKCYWFSAASDELGGKMALFLFSPPIRARLADARSRETVATMGHCPMTSGMYKVEAKTRKEGSFVLGVYSVPAAP